MDVLSKIKKIGLVPVVVLDDAAAAADTAKALLAGGVGAMEITFRTAAAADAIRAVSERCPEMLVGAGTVLNVGQCELAVACGAKFLVSPGFDEASVRWAQAQGVPIVPGCATPTEIMAALACGLDTVKFFPAGVYGGLKAMKALAAPFGGVSFIPTGGISAENLAEYAAAPFIGAIGGSWLCTKGDIAAGRYDTITELCKQAVSIIKEARA